MYHHALQNSQLIIEKEMIIFKEDVHGEATYVKLQVIPKGLRDVIFVAFHSNPIGGHFNVYQTFHRIKLRFYWPGMYKYVKKMCRQCPGCALANRTKRKSSELLYSFPIKAPFQALHIDGYYAGQFKGFEGSELYLVACCGMCTFAVMEPVDKPNSTYFASVIMKMQLRFGFSHTYHRPRQW